MNENEVIVYFAKLIESVVGIVYEEHNFFQLKDRLERLAQAFECKSLAELIKVKDHRSEEFLKQLIDISTNNETSFFRDTKFFECVEKTILPQLAADCKSLSSLQIWSVASSTGQEPYSVAMLLLELGKKLNGQPSRLLATDVSTKVLMKAKSGKYSELEVNRGLPTHLRHMYFREDINKNWILKDEVRNLVDYQHLNLCSPFSLPQQFDLILCRNVLIYQRIEAKREIIKRVTHHLRPGGIFLLGAGESLMGLSDDFEQKLVDGVAVYTKRSAKKAAA